MIKRFLDIALSSIGLVAVTPIIAAAGLAIWWQSPGPVFFRGLRAGLRGREFRIWKLRTMAVGADACRSLTGREDPRIFPVGRFLRRWKIDELPQLINVLVGDMSLVSLARGRKPHPL
jgi:lipopolysaccharide/colanic/teichoic acid biosynthesis glycosyltransferase